ncbi:hypothetical protein BCE_2374 [Bacillus cereus ATCC 10987]|uniref:Uncharacterized protein n=1 Tax=Bacillus cereus (strain ATCC 10987 / NRS 248) TaxID=222523 RepID=Q738M0_BACC1|nr:hypothetical protein BCE_2374 [Bacillus cereus ATCC 10987]
MQLLLLNKKASCIHIQLAFRIIFISLFSKYNFHIKFIYF